MEGDSLFPKDVWKLIGSNLDSYSLWCLKRTCKRFHGDIFKEHLKVKSTDIEAVLHRYATSIIRKDQNFDIHVFQTLLSDLLGNYRYSMPFFLLDHLVSLAVKTLDSPEVLNLLRYHTSFSFPLKILMRDVIYDGQVWKCFAAHFLSSHEIIKECFTFWSFTTEDRDYAKHFCWIVKNGISPHFIARAFDEYDTKVIHAILYDLGMFLKLGFNFSGYYLYRMQECINDELFKTTKPADMQTSIRFLVHKTGFVTGRLCALLKKHKIHDEVVGNICACCNYQVTKKLKIIK